MRGLRSAVLCATCCVAQAYVLPGAVPAPRAASVSAVRMEAGVESLPLMMPGQKSWMPKSVDTALSAKKWYVVDANGMRLGRMSSEIAKILLGKHKPTYTPGADTGDYVIVVNAEKVMVTGKKASQKLYRRHSGRPGGMKIESFEELQERIPERIVEKAVKGMLPKNSYGRELFRHLKVFKGPEHEHESQQPEPLTFSGLTVTPDSQVLELEDPDDPTCATFMGA